MGTMLFYGAIHIAQRQTSKELIAEANLLVQSEWTPMNLDGDGTFKCVSYDFRLHV